MLQNRPVTLGVCGSVARLWLNCVARQCWSSYRSDNQWTAWTLQLWEVVQLIRWTLSCDSVPTAELP